MTENPNNPKPSCAVCGSVDLTGPCQTPSGRHWAGDMPEALRRAMTDPALEAPQTGRQALAAALEGLGRADALRVRGAVPRMSRGRRMTDEALEAFPVADLVTPLPVEVAVAIYAALSEVAEDLGYLAVIREETGAGRIYFRRVAS